MKCFKLIVPVIAAVLFAACEQVNSDKSFFAYTPPPPAAPGETPAPLGAPPQEVKAIAADGFVTVKWLPLEGIDNYEIFINTEEKIPHEPFAAIQNNYTTILSPLANKTLYSIWVRGIGAEGPTAYSDAVKAIPWPAGEAPAAPAAPRIVAGIEQLTALWEITGGAAEYEVYINTTPVAPETPAVTVRETSAAVPGLQNGQIYYFWVKAKNAVGASALSAPQAGTPRAATTLPAAPGKPELEPGSKRIGVRWNAAEMASSYEVWYGTSAASESAAKYGGDITMETRAEIGELSNGVTYYVWVKSKNSLGASVFSPAASAAPSAFAEPPQAPAAPTVTAGSRQLSVSWQAAEGALSYEVWWGTSDNAGQMTKHSDVSGRSLTITGLANGVTRYFRLKAKNDKGISWFGDAGNGTPLAIYAPPAAPAAPAITAGNGQLTLSWSAVDGASAYEIWAGTANNSGNATKRGADITETSAALTGLANGATHYVWLKAKNSTGTSGFGAAASGMPLASAGPPAAPAAPVVTALGSGQVTISWYAVEGAAAYEVWVGASSSFVSAVKNGGDVTALSKTITGLTNGTTYYVWVKSKNSLGTSGASTMASAIPIATPAAPTVMAGNRSLALSWQAAAGAAQYEIFCGTSTTAPASPAQTVSGTSATLTGLTNGTTYYVWVRGKNASGVGVMSARGTGDTPGAGGLFKGVTFASATKIGSYGVGSAINYINANALDGDNYYIVVGEDQTLGQQSLSISGKNVSVTLIGEGVERTLTLGIAGSLFTVSGSSGKQVTLTLDNNISLVGRTDNTAGAGLVVIGSYGKLVMKDGAKISGNTATFHGVGVSVGAGTFTMLGGTISGNTSEYGGGVRVNNNGTFTMSGGTISGNTAGYGGGVYLESGTFTMSGGTISGNTASYGGGVYVNYSTFTMSGGTISGNTAFSGGGVDCNSDNTFTMSGGIISGNTASYGGGGVDFGSGTFTMSGGTISGNTYRGVYLLRNNTFTKTNTGGIIYGNNASPSSLKNTGCAVYCHDSHKYRYTTIPANEAFDSSSNAGWE